MEMNSGLSSKKTPPRVIIAHGIWSEDLLTKDHFKNIKEGTS